jgi:hypothetical protein
MVDEDTNMKGNWVKGIGNSVFSLRFYYKYGIAPKKLIQKWKHLMLAVVDHNVAVCISWTLISVVNRTATWCFLRASIN